MLDEFLLLGADPARAAVGVPERERAEFERAFNKLNFDFSVG